MPMVESKRQIIKAKIEKRLKEIENAVACHLLKERIDLIKDDTKVTFLNLQSLYEFETAIPKPTVFVNNENNMNCFSEKTIQK